MPKAQHSPAYRAVHELLRDMRERAGLTQRALAARLNKRQTWVLKSERGYRRIDIAEFVAWARACDTDPRQAFTKVLDVIR